jgi:hypothetical protein
MRKLAVAILVGLLLSGCGRSKPTYRLTVVNKQIHDTRVVNLPVHDDPKLIQDDIIRNVKPLWDNLASGNSAEFYCERVTPWNLGEPSKESLEEKGMTATCTTETGHWRFFKGKKGECGFGIESLGSDNKWQPCVSCGGAAGWQTIESRFRSSCLNVDIIRRCIQLDDGQHQNSKTP